MADRLSDILNGGIISNFESSRDQDLWNQAQEYFDRGDYVGAQQFLADNGFRYKPEQEKWLDNMIAMQDKQQSQSWEQMMRDSELLATAKQLSALGLNVGNVASMGRVSTPSVENAALSKAPTAEQRLERKHQMTKAVLGLVSHMASAGIGGIALGTARGIAAKMGRSTSEALLDNMNKLEQERDKWKHAFMSYGAQVALERSKRYK